MGEEGRDVLIFKLTVDASDDVPLLLVKVIEIRNEFRNLAEFLILRIH